MLTKKHFEAAARSIKFALDLCPTEGSVNYRRGFRQGVSDTAWELADMFGDENPNFDKARFMHACGLEG